MASITEYAHIDPPRAEIDAIDEAAVIEFGSNSCGICAAAEPRIAQAMADHPGLRHIRVEDGRGKKLGRSFGVKLWPTLVFMDQGKEVARLVRPYDAGVIGEALEQIDPVKA